MKKLRMKRLGLWLTIALCLALGLCLFVGCTPDGGDTDTARNELSGQIETISRDINVAVENYPDLQAHREIADAMQQNMYLQREITAARELYNDTIDQWNRDIFAWPTKKIVAAKNGYTTRIPFIASKEIKQQARSVFF